MICGGGRGVLFHIIFVAPDRVLANKKPRASFGAKSFFWNVDEGKE